MGYQLLKSKPLKTGINKGKCIYYLKPDSPTDPLAYTKPLSLAEAEPLRQLVKDPAKVKAYITMLESQS